mmetsp:Transcript_18267/g.40662  ORF Transcript_18267/g.40662 Transcript_18267/m.40662 type:complete len:231 (-) Transcript_18267:173-865(-)
MTDAQQSFRTAERFSMARANLFALLCALILAAYTLVLLRPGAVWAGLPAAAAASRARLLFAFGIIYLLRVNVMARWLLPRELAQEELTVVPLWILSILASYSLGAIRLTEEMDAPVMGVSTLLYVLGSWLNSWSELQRKWWKALPENKGRCYTRGLFSLSRNINYLGDCVLFAGWAGASGCWWNAWVPIVMAASFHFYHIPEKETYLSKRYEADWPAYQRRVKSFVPFIC